MATFAMCPDCARSTATPSTAASTRSRTPALPADRVSVVGRDGAAVEAADPIAHVGRALAQGAIAAVKGIGGYHLACDATSSAAVATLRARKHREEKPLAVMVRDLEAARALAEVGEAEAALLASVERPIVLCRRRPWFDRLTMSGGLAPEIAPDSPLVGLLLPYAPLHLLLDAAARPLVMTSGNLSDEPIAFEDEDAIRRLGAIADLFLVHDRPIASRCDDSVARTIAGRPLVMRRSRGYVPRPVIVRRRFTRPVLAVGAQLKNTFCLARGDEAVLGPHVGDLDDLETYAAFEAAIARLEAFLALTPEAVACDLHPLYLSTRYARERAAALGVPLVEVQHHHAHAAAAMAEHGLDGPVLALAWDGTGLGTDGTAWGGELLLVERGTFERLATFRRSRSPAATAPSASRGGSRSRRCSTPSARTRRSSGSRCSARSRRASWPSCAASSRPASTPRARTAPGAPSTRRARSPSAAGCRATRGRLRSRSTTPPAGPRRTRRRTRSISTRQARSPRSICAWRALAADVIAGAAPAIVSARFHAALVRAGVELVQRASRATGRLPVVLTGGCFQNARLAEGILAGLSLSFEVYPHGQVPPGDGGIALGQALVADARARPWRSGTMCLGVPGKVVAIDGMSATVDFFGVRKELRLDIVDEPVSVGDYVLNHVGFAIRRIPPDEVQETLALFDQILDVSGAKADLMAEDVRGEIAAAKHKA